MVKRRAVGHAVWLRGECGGDCERDVLRGGAGAEFSQRSRGVRSACDAVERPGVDEPLHQVRSGLLGDPEVFAYLGARYATALVRGELIEQVQYIRDSPLGAIRSGYHRRLPQASSGHQHALTHSANVAPDDQQNDVG